MMGKIETVFFMGDMELMQCGTLPGPEGLIVLTGTFTYGKAILIVNPDTCAVYHRSLASEYANASKGFSIQFDDGRDCLLTKRYRSDGLLYEQLTTIGDLSVLGLVRILGEISSEELIFVDSNGNKVSQLNMACGNNGTLTYSIENGVDNVLRPLI